jgi:hypothetical protein
MEREAVVEVVEARDTLCHLGEMVGDGVDDTLEFCNGQEIIHTKYRSFP